MPYIKINFPTVIVLMCTLCSTSKSRGIIGSLGGMCVQFVPWYNPIFAGLLLLRHAAFFLFRVFIYFHTHAIHLCTFSIIEYSTYNQKYFYISITISD